jgi:hypothetical protein
MRQRIDGCETVRGDRTEGAQPNCTTMWISCLLLQMPHVGTAGPQDMLSSLTIRTTQLGMCPSLLRITHLRVFTSLVTQTHRSILVQECVDKD